MESPPPNTARKWVGQNVRHHRERLGLNITQLAERVTACGIPVARSQMSKIESGQTNVDVEKLLALAAALEVIPDRLLRDPAQLDRAIYLRLRDRWKYEIREMKRHESLAQIIVEELAAIAKRVEGAAEDLEDIMYEEHLTQWVLNIERVDAQDAGYAGFLDRLIDGRAVAEEFSRDDPDGFLESFLTDSRVKSTKNPKKNTKKGGK